MIVYIVSFILLFVLVVILSIALWFEGNEVQNLKREKESLDATIVERGHMIVALRNEKREAELLTAEREKQISELLESLTALNLGMESFRKGM